MSGVMAHHLWISARKRIYLRVSVTSYLHYPIKWETIKRVYVSTRNILGLPLTNFYWKCHISSIAKSVSAKLGILYHPSQYFPPSQMLQMYKGLVCTCMEYASHVGGLHPHSSLKQSTVHPHFSGPYILYFAVLTLKI